MTDPNLMILLFLFEQLLAMTSGSLYTAERYELGTIDNKPLSELTEYAWHVSSASSLSILSVALGKVSVVLFLNRLIGPLAVKLHFYVLWTMVLFAFVTAIANAVVIWRSCVPLTATYGHNIDGSCINKQVHLCISMTQAGTLSISNMRAGRSTDSYSFQRAHGCFTCGVCGLGFLAGKHCASAQNWPCDGYGSWYPWSGHHGYQSI